ncbi:MAG: hypothetical protein AAF089_04300 [Bacteroidota bacterium]
MRAAVLLPLLVALAACTNGDTPADPTVADSVAASPNAPLPPLRLADLAAACEGHAVPRAATYSATPSEPPRLFVLVRDSLGAPYRSSTSEVFFRSWGVYNSSDYPATEVAACLTGFAGEFLRTCAFESSLSDSTYTLDLYAASYNVRLRAAQTGALLGEFGLDATSDSCPLFHTFADNGEQERSLVTPPMQDLKDAVLARLAPDYDVRREFMDDDEIRTLDSMDAVVDSLRRLNS